MVKELDCTEGGCEFLIRDENEEELIEMVQQHAEQSHGQSFSREAVQDHMKEV